MQTAVPIMEIESIKAQEQDYLYTTASNLPNAGLGLFTAMDIFKNEKIAVFKGKILTAKQIAFAVSQQEDQYFMNTLDGKILDCKNTDCFAKYANDAKGTSHTTIRNNAIITITEQNQICIVATKKIIAGSEIFVSYGKRYWEKHGVK